MTSKATLETSESMFAVLTALNACGYDQDLASSPGLRIRIRSEVTQAIQASTEATAATNEVCKFIQDHKPADASKELAQYVSLALLLGPPPEFAAVEKEADFPPDASYVLGLVPLVQNFYKAAGLHEIWENHEADRDALVQRYHDAVAKMIMDTDVYLRLPFSGFVGRKFTVLMAPMGAPGQINARNYGSEYYVVVTPVGNSLKTDEIRHTYLHYVLDPLAQKRPMAMKRLQPLLLVVQPAPMDETFKKDMGLLVTESLIQAIEARTRNGGKAPEAERERAVDSSMQQGFVLTQYFYSCLAKFEKEPVGLKDAYPDWLYYLNIDQEKKRASNIQFAAKAAPEVVRASTPSQESLLDKAEKSLSAGDHLTAQKLADQALQQKDTDQGRAFFVLAKAASLNKDMAGARKYFQRTLEVAHEPRLVAWSHIYLGRIFDLQEDRDAAMGEYRAALKAGDPAPEVKAAAERGLKQAYEPPAKQQ